MPTNTQNINQMLFTSQENPTESYNFRGKPSSTKVIELNTDPKKVYSKEFIKTFNKKSKEDSFKRFGKSVSQYNQSPLYTNNKSDIDKRIERMINGMKQQANRYEKQF